MWAAIIPKASTALDDTTGNWSRKGQCCCDSLHPCWEAYHLAEGYSSLPFLSYGIELGKALSSYVQDVFCSHIYSPSNYNGLHSCTFDCRSELAFYLNVFSSETTLEFPFALQTARGGVRISFIISYVNSSACISSSCTLCKQSDTLQCKGTLICIHGNSLFSICHWECFNTLLPMPACFEKVVFIGTVWVYLAFFILSLASLKCH
jgi:hypothetical protein